MKKIITYPLQYKTISYFKIEKIIPGLKKTLFKNVEKTRFFEKLKKKHNKIFFYKNGF